MLPHLEQFHSFDNCQLVYRHWIPKVSSQRWIVIFHRGHEHSARLEELAESFCEKNYHVFAWDARGNGESQGPRDDAQSFSVLIRDAQLFIDFLADKHNLQLENLAVIGNSIGALIAAGWVHDYAPNIRALILAAPAFRIKLYMPFAIPLLRIARKLKIMKRVTSYVKAKVLTHDRIQQQSFNQDPLISHGIATDLLIDTYDTGTRLLADAGAINVPVLILSAGKDWVVKNKAQRSFYLALNSVHKEWQYYADFYHAIYHEDQRQQPIERSLDFVHRMFEKTVDVVDYQHADQHGFSRDQQDALSLIGMRADFYLTKLVFKTIGKLSTGINIALQHGFDSGSSLDYVYKNIPQGCGFLGKLIDKSYLNSPGWRGIRERKAQLDQLLNKYCSLNQSDTAQSTPFEMLDIACGNGRYVIDFLARSTASTLGTSRHINVELRDYVELNLEKAELYAQSQNISDNRAISLSYDQCDAFDEQSYLVEQHFDVVIISGLLELESSNAKALQAINGASKLLKEGGYLIYTNQPWHPQLEFIAAVLDNHCGKPWHMRPRSQAEIDALVAQAHFKKVEMMIDMQGIFSVSVAQKITQHATL